MPRESRRGEQGGRESRERKEDGGKKPRRHRKEKRQKQTTEPGKGRGSSSSTVEDPKPELEPELGPEGRALQEQREGKAHSSQQKIKVVGLNT